jgi:hypothetical protein
MEETEMAAVTVKMAKTAEATETAAGVMMATTVEVREMVVVGITDGKGGGRWYIRGNTGS